jgi:phage-related protein
MHRVSFGLNQNAKIFNLTFEVSEADADTLTNFLDERAVDGANFTYTVPGESAMNFVLERGYNKNVPFLGRARVQVTFRQVFEPSS